MDRAAPPRVDLPTPLPGQSRAPGRVAGFALMFVLVVLAGITVLRSGPRPGLASDGNDPAPKQPPLFQGWKKPDLAIILSGQAHGYLQPCGCSEPQYGGLARRYKFLQGLRDKGWEVLPLDLGDMAAEKTQGPQAVLKYTTFMKSLDAMGYKAVGLGKHELLMPLTDALINYSANHASPRPVSANLAKTEPGQLFHRLNVRPYEVIPAGNFRVGVFGVASPSTIQKVTQAFQGQQQDVEFVDNRAAIPKVMEELAKSKANISIMLYNGSLKEAIACTQFAWELYQQNKAQGWPLVHAVLCLDDATDPPNLAERIPGIPTQIIMVGHKGRYLGVLGLSRNERSLEVRYQSVKIGPEYGPTDAEHAKNPVSRIMEDYSKDVQKANFLASFQRSLHPTQVAVNGARYVGSEQCARCHAHAHDVWEKSAHSHAFKTLVDAKHPSGRQYDPECVMCHTVGFQYQGGWQNPKEGLTAKQKDKHNFELRNVGCESCHGPASMHVNQPDNEEYHKLINPFGPKAMGIKPGLPQARIDQLNAQRLQKIDFFCQKCHDEENDVHWGTVTFKKKWIDGKIEHPTPPRDKK